MADKAKTETVEACGASGLKFQLGLYSINTNFKSVGGVYVFVKETPDSNGKVTYEAIYIGKTSDLSSRFSNHHKADAIRKCGANRLAVMSITTEAERTQIEKDLLGNYNTPCNEILN